MTAPASVPAATKIMITYDRYTELLSKRINRTLTDPERTDLSQFEAAQPPSCPRCSANLRSYFLPDQIVHDVDKCDRSPLSSPQT